MGVALCQEAGAERAGAGLPLGTGSMAAASFSVWSGGQFHE